MLSSYSVECPYENCLWIGNLIPSLLQGGKDSEIAPMQKAWFQCPRCQRDWEVQIINDTVKVLPVIAADNAVTALISATHPLAKVEQSGKIKVVTFTAGSARDVENVL